MFYAALVCMAVLGADKSSATAKVEERPFHAILAEISDLLKREAQAKEPVVRADIVRRMCELHGEILRDERYATSDTLADYRIRLWSRLRRVQADLKRQLARADKGSRKAAEDDAALSEPDELSLAAADSLATTLSMLDQSQGGPGYLMGLGGGASGSGSASSGARGGGAGSGDYGDELVDLIQQTINPAFWDVNGGPGTIVYYRPLHCIVVRATSEMHGNVGGILGGLRAAGK